MGNKEEMEMEYVSVYVPDMPRIIEFVKQAKGPHRTMAQFAEALSAEENVSISASTLSRIVNNNKAKPLSVELIKAMVNRADESDNISFSEFMRANGMVPKQEVEEREARRRERGITYPDNSAKRENKKREIRNIISEELNARGIMTMILRRIPPKDNTADSLILGKYRCDFVVRTQEIEPKFWGFHLYNDYYDDDEKDIREKYLNADMIGEIQNRSCIFLTDLWEPKLYSDTGIKNTFLFTARDVFEIFCNKLQNIKVNTNMSIMLIDLQERKIVSEIPFKRRDEKVIESLLDREKVEFDSFDEDDVSFD